MTEETMPPYARVDQILFKVTQLVYEASHILNSDDDDYEERIRKQVNEEMRAALSTSAEISSDGKLLVEIWNESGDLVKNEFFDLLDVLTFTTCDIEEDGRQRVRAALEKALTLFSAPPTQE